MRNMSLFGFGSRKCLGQYFAEKYLRSFVFHLFDQYQVTWNNPSIVAAEEWKEDKTTTFDLYKVEFRLVDRLAAR